MTTTFFPVGQQTFFLQSSISSTATSIILSSLTEPVSGTLLTMAYMGSDIQYMTIEPRTTNSEFISFTGITQNANGTATLTGVVRGLMRVSPYTTSATFKVPHAGGSQIIFGDSPQIWSALSPSSFLASNNTWTGNNTFNTGTVNFNGVTTFASQQLISASPTFSGSLTTGYTTTATAAGTTTLTVTSSYTQYFTGATTQTVTMPVTSTLTLGQSWMIVNNSSGAVTINSSGANAIIILAGGTSALVTCILTSGTGSASWDATYRATAITTAKKLSVSNSLTLAGTDSTTMTFPSTSATVARTDAANTFTGVSNTTSWNMITPVLGVATGTSLAVTGLITSSGTAGMGYATGAGGSVGQSVSKANGVQLDKITGQITMHNATLNAATVVSFTLTNSTIAVTDQVIINHISVGTLGAYTFAVANNAGSAAIYVRNATAGNLSEAIVLQFTVIKAVIT